MGGGDLTPPAPFLSSADSRGKGEASRRGSIPGFSGEPPMACPACSQAAGESTHEGPPGPHRRREPIRPSARPSPNRGVYFSFARGGIACRDCARRRTRLTVKGEGVLALRGLTSWSARSQSVGSSPVARCLQVSNLCTQFVDDCCISDDVKAYCESPG